MIIMKMMVTGTAITIIGEDDKNMGGNTIMKQ
jgi:hypothetical protein